MTVDLLGVTAVLLPGSGSDDNYVNRAFGPALRAAGAMVAAHRPQPAQLLAGYRAALDAAAADAPIAVAGVSLGAAVAVSWAVENPDRVRAVIAALPAWTGAPDQAMAALAAQNTAVELRRHGLAAVIAQMRETSPTWLGDELSRSWSTLWPDLPDALEAAAGCPGPTVEQLHTLSAPLAVVSASDDLIHPLAVGAQWAAAAPRAALRTLTLAQLGADPAVLGRTALAALADLD